MKRFVICLAALGLLAIPAVASAETQYVWIRYGGAQPYLYVTTTPYPAPPRTYVGPGGVVFDSEVGKACGALRTDVHFAPNETSLDQYDRNILAGLAHCFTRGPLSGVGIELVVGYDGSPASSTRAYTRLGEVIETLGLMGVSTEQLVYSRELRPGWQADKVSFRFTQPRVWPYRDLLR